MPTTVNLSVGSGETKNLTFNCGGTFVTDDIEFVITGSGGDTNTTLSGVAYCPTAASTTAKVATMPGFALSTGQRIILYLANSNTKTSATLNVNSTGAKAIRIGGAYTTTSNFTAGYWICNYDGTYWNAEKMDNSKMANGAGYTTNTGTVTSVGLSSATNGGLTISGSPVTGSGTIGVGHSNVLQAVGTDVGNNTTTSLSHSGTFSVPYFSYDINGHITSASTKTLTLPASGNTDNYGTVYVQTAGSTRAKTAIVPWTYTLKTGNVFVLYLKNTNTVTTSGSTYVTLNINSTGAKQVRIDGAVPTTTNWTAGTYLCYYDGTYYQMYTNKNPFNYNDMLNLPTNTGGGTVTSITAATGLLSTTANGDGGTIQTSGTLYLKKINIFQNQATTATMGPSSDVTVSSSSNTFTVPQFTFDIYGRVTHSVNKTITITGLGGGSDNTFRVNFTILNGTISCDHTIAEIYTAYTDGKIILGSDGIGMHCILHNCSSTSVQFLTYETIGGMLIRGTHSGNTDVWSSFNKQNLYTVIFTDDGNGQYLSTPSFYDIADAINRIEPIIIGRLDGSSNVRDYILTYHDFNSNNGTHTIRFTSYKDTIIYEMVGEATYSNGSYTNETWTEISLGVSGGGGGGTHYVGKNVFTNTSSGTSNTAVNSGTIYLNHVENNSVTTNGSLSIVAGTGITVQTNGSGQLTISSTGGGGGSVSYLSDLTDVESSPITGNVLQFNGTIWTGGIAVTNVVAGSGLNVTSGDTTTDGGQIGYLDANETISSTGTIHLTRVNTASSYNGTAKPGFGPTANKTVTSSSNSFHVPYYQVDKFGRVTGSETRTITISGLGGSGGGSSVSASAGESMNMGYVAGKIVVDNVETEFIVPPARSVLGGGSQYEYSSQGLVRPRFEYDMTYYSYGEGDSNELSSGTSKIEDLENLTIFIDAPNPSDGKRIVLLPIVTVYYENAINGRMEAAPFLALDSETASSLGLFNGYNKYFVPKIKK